MKNRGMNVGAFSVGWPRKGYDIGVWYEPDNFLGRRSNWVFLHPSKTSLRGTEVRPSLLYGLPCVCLNRFTQK